MSNAQSTSRARSAGSVRPAARARSAGHRRGDDAATHRPADDPAGPARARHPRGRAVVPRGGGARIGLALAGGGPLGAIYEIGALRALADGLEGVDFNALHVYVGVSAGAFVSAGLANGLSIGQIYRVFIENDPDDRTLTPDVFRRPALREYATRAAGLPGLLIDALARYLRDPRDATVLESLSRAARSLPAGVFDNDVIAEHVARLLTRAGTDDFRELPHRLYVVATDLDTAEVVRFGAPGHDHVPISRAIQASSALPGVFPPVEIEGRHYVDGALTRTVHASVALEAGADLVLCINPIVPFDARLAREQGRHPHRLVEGGLPVVLSQTFRALVHSRMGVGMARYARSHPHADLVLFEPDRGDPVMFFTNLFSYAKRREVCEHAYQRTRADLLARRVEIEPILARHGVRLRLDALRDPQRHAAEEPTPRGDLGPSGEVGAGGIAPGGIAPGERIARRSHGVDPASGNDGDPGGPATGGGALRELARTLDTLQSWVEANGG